MSVIPEHVIRSAIMRGIQLFRQKPKLVDVLFADLTQEQQEAIRSYLLGKIDFSIGFPRKDFTCPSLVLMLRNEDQAQSFLGDFMGMESDPEFLGTDITPAASVSHLKNLGKLIVGGIGVDSSDDSTIVFAEDQESVILQLRNLSLTQMSARVVEGTGVGQVFDVEYITADSLGVKGTIYPELDDTSVIELRESGVFNRDANPSKLFAENSVLERIGANYLAFYQLYIFAENSFNVLVLYAIIRAILFGQRQFLESNGIMGLSIAGFDSVHRPEFIPDEVFQRVMTLQFTYPFTTVKELETISEIELNLRLDCTDDTVTVNIDVDDA